MVKIVPQPIEFWLRLLSSWAYDYLCCLTIGFQISKTGVRQLPIDCNNNLSAAVPRKAADALVAAKTRW